LVDARSFASQALVRDALSALVATRTLSTTASTELATLGERADYHDLLLIDANGDVVFSLRGEADLGTNLLHGPFRDSELAAGFRQAMVFMHIDMTRFEPYAPSGGEVAAFVVAPILDAQRPLGALALQVNLATLMPVVSDRTGLGASGETVLAVQESQAVRYTVPLERMPGAAFTNLVQLARTAEPMRMALAGNQGQILMSQALHAAHREGRLLAVLFIDLDRFKVINDTLGHHIGDLLLVEVAHRLCREVRESDIVARQGGDEFVVVLTALECAQDAAVVADKILHALGEPYDIESDRLHTSPSIGISVYPDDGLDADTLTKHADTAMYHAQEQGRNNIQYFTEALNVAAGERLTVERELRFAIEEGQLALHYQPQFEGAADPRGAPYAMEALVRWRHPRRGLVTADHFIPIAEESGLIHTIGDWVLNEACRRLAEWKAAGIGPRRIAVNLSAHQLRNPALLQKVAAVLRRYELHDDELELEVTESVAMRDPARAVETPQALRNLGVALAIDDFGTGHSSLAYLKRLPIQTLKLDREFVRDIETDENDAAISAATLALAHELGLRVVAEGIETEGQSRFLRAHGCDLLQGYLYGKPEPAEFWTARWARDRSAELTCTRNHSA
jgi:diguanylate cyclase (GGDEF)-like protein